MVKRRFYCLSSLLAVLLGWFGSLPLSCSTTSSAGIDFSYDPSASNGPTHWGQLKDSSMCSQGKLVSLLQPVAIDKATMTGSSSK